LRCNVKIKVTSHFKNSFGYSRWRPFGYYVKTIRGFFTDCIKSIINPPHGVREYHSSAVELADEMEEVQ